jgi:hypothetical protein
VSNYDSVILADGPVAFWPLNETVGATANDLTGHGHHGIISAGCSLGQPGIGDGETSIGFDGAAGHVGVGAAASLQPNVGPWSAECWFKTRATGSQTGAVLSMGGGYQPHAGTGMLAVLSGGSGIDAARQASPVLTDGAWHYGAVTWLGSTSPTTFYIDGAFRTATIASLAGQPIVTPSAPLLIGASPLFSGQIAKPAVYGKALTASQVAQHYHAASTVSATGTMATIVVRVDGTGASTAIAVIGGGSPPVPITPPVVT